MSDSGSKFGIFGKLKETTEERDSAKAEKQKDIKIQKQENIKAGKLPVSESEAKVELSHYSSYMPADLYHELQAYVLKLKSERQKGQERPSVQAVITAAVRVYLDQNK